MLAVRNTGNTSVRCQYSIAEVHAVLKKSTAGMKYSSTTTAPAIYVTAPKGSTHRQVGSVTSSNATTPNLTPCSSPRRHASSDSETSSASLSPARTPTVPLNVQMTSSAPGSCENSPRGVTPTFGQPVQQPGRRNSLGPYSTGGSLKPGVRVGTRSSLKGNYSRSSDAGNQDASEGYPVLLGGAAPTRKSSANLLAGHAGQARSAPSRSKRSGRFEVGDLRLGGLPFDPRNPQVRSQLIAALGANPGATVEAASCVTGGLNQGIWFLRGGGEELVMKLVKFNPRAIHESLIEERCFAKLYKENPGIASDPAIAFPFKILRILGAGNMRQHDLIVMSKAPGSSIDKIITEKWRSGQKAMVRTMFQAVGRSMAEFHRRYNGKQHCDAGPQNIYFDEVTGHVTFIDVGGMGGKTNRTDIQMLTEVVTNLSAHYGAELKDCLKDFEEGYSMC